MNFNKKKKGNIIKISKVGTNALVMASGQNSTRMRREIRHSKIKKVQNRIQDYHEIKHTKVVESHNNDRKLQLRKEMDNIHQYEVLSNRHNYYDYKYMFYVGTLFDTYI